MLKGFSTLLLQSCLFMKSSEFEWAVLHHGSVAKCCKLRLSVVICGIDTRDAFVKTSLGEKPRWSHYVSLILIRRSHLLLIDLKEPLLQFFYNTEFKVLKFEILRFVDLFFAGFARGTFISVIINLNRLDSYALFGAIWSTRSENERSWSEIKV